MGRNLAPSRAMGIAALCGFLLMASSGTAAFGSPRAVYVQTNSAPNYVLAFDRNSDGTLGGAIRYATGGNGKPTANPPLGIPFLDSAGSVVLSDDGRFLFVVNAGDNSVTSFRVGPGGLQREDNVNTDGSRPISATSHGKLLYVLNSEATQASITGFRVGADGTLIQIAHQSTSQPNGGMPAQIQFDASGDWLTVSERNGGAIGQIDVFAVDKNGVAGAPSASPSSDNGPFGIAFTHQDLMIVSNEHFPDVFAPGPLLSTVSSYAFSDGSIAAIDTELANAGGACWNVITNDDKYVLVTSPFTGNINSFAIGKHGKLIPVNESSVVATASGATLDEALSRDSHHLYVLDSAGFVSSVVDEYAVNKDGTVTLVGSTAAFEGSASGAAAW